MRVVDKENKAKKVNLYFDYKNYKGFLEEIYRTGKRFEKKSNPKNLKYAVVLNSTKIPTEKVKGWASRTEDMKSVIFFDMDCQLRWLVEAQLQVVMKEFNLSCFYLFSTEISKDSNGDEFGNFLCFCPDKKDFHEIIQIQNRTTCDESYKRLPMEYRFKTWCWRWSKKFSKGKPKFLSILGDPKKIYPNPVSSAHLDFMKKLYPKIPKLKYSNPDKLKKLWLVEYKTGSK